MATVLVLYGTGEGQTAKVAARIGEVLDARGHGADVVDVADAPATLAIEDFDAVVVGSAIHYGTHASAIRDWIGDHVDELADRPTAFFQVSLSSVSDDPDRRAEAAGYVDAILEETGWHPDRIGLFGGALRYSKYGFLKRLVMKQIAREATGDVDASRDYEYTGWAEVEAFANDVAAFVDGRAGSTSAA